CLILRLLAGLQTPLARSADEDAAFQVVQLHQQTAIRIRNGIQLVVERTEQQADGGKPLLAVDQLKSATGHAILLGVHTDDGAQKVPTGRLLQVIEQRVPVLAAPHILALVLGNEERRCPIGAEVETDRQRFDVLNHSSPPVFFLPRVFFGAASGSMYKSSRPCAMASDLSVLHFSRTRSGQWAIGRCAQSSPPFFSLAQVSLSTFCQGLWRNSGHSGAAQICTPSSWLGL